MVVKNCSDTGVGAREGNVSAQPLDGAAPGEENEGLRSRAKRRRRQRINEAAAKLLLDKTFDEITTKEVAAEAGIGEATLFRYIRSKQELLTIVYGDQLDRVLNRIESDDARTVADSIGHALSSRHFIDRVLGAYHTRCDFYLLNPTNAARYLREGFDIGTPESARHIAQGDRTIRLVTAILRDGQDRGLLTRAVDAYVVAQNCHGTYMHEIDRTPVRGFEPTRIWDRLETRLRVQLDPLAIDIDRGLD